MVEAASNIQMEQFSLEPLKIMKSTVWELFLIQLTSWNKEKNMLMVSENLLLEAQLLTMNFLDIFNIQVINYIMTILLERLIHHLDSA